MDKRVALITGASRGLGRAVALALGAMGCHVLINYRSQEQAAAETLAVIKRNGGHGELRPFDVANPEACDRAINECLKAHERIDILVNNAGITASVKFADTDDATWERIMRVNASGPFFCCRAAVPDMIERGAGRIINIASYAALSGLPFSSAYSASKHALLGLTRSLALELARYNITANAICPGWVETDMVQNAVDTIVAKTGRSADAARAGILALAGQPRMLAPEQVAAVALRLAGPEGASINGQAVMIE